MTTDQRSVRNTELRTWNLRYKPSNHKKQRFLTTSKPIDVTKVNSYVWFWINQCVVDLWAPELNKLSEQIDFFFKSCDKIAITWQVNLDGRSHKPTSWRLTVAELRGHNKDIKPRCENKGKSLQTLAVIFIQYDEQVYCAVAVTKFLSR